MAAVGTLLHALPAESSLHLANSSAVRYAQLYALPDSVEVCCNRGVNGIEGSLSTAMGYALASARLNFVVIGDLSFFYDMNALWNRQLRNNLRILLLNNGSGEIFQSLPGLHLPEPTQQLVAGKHQTSAKGWAEERGFHYQSVHNAEELAAAIPPFTQTETASTQPMLMEVFTDATHDIELLKAYYHQLKNSFAQ